MKSHAGLRIAVSSDKRLDMLAVLLIWSLLVQEHPVFCRDGGCACAGHISWGGFPRRDIPRRPAPARPCLQPWLPAALKMVCAGMAQFLPISPVSGRLESKRLLHPVSP